MRIATLLLEGLTAALASTLLVVGMIDMVSAGMTKTQGGKMEIAPPESARPVAAAGSARAAPSPADIVLEQHIAALTERHREAERLIERLRRGEPAEPTENSALRQKSIGKAQNGLIGWLVRGISPMWASPQWWNYVALMLCQGLVIWFWLVHMTLSLGALRISPPVVAGLADWAINAPPILGVVGTIIAFSGFISASGTSAITGDAFGKAFFDAAATTVVGGLIYVINLFLYAAFSGSLVAAEDAS